MSVTTVGALIGGAIDDISGGSPAEGAMIGAVTANVLKIALPIVVTYAVGWGVLRGLAHVRELLATGRGTAAAG